MFVRMHTDLPQTQSILILNYFKAVENLNFMLKFTKESQKVVKGIFPIDLLGKRYIKRILA